MAIMLEGSVKPDQFVRLLLESEDGFVLHYPHGRRVNVAFHKGTWILAKFDDEQLRERVEFDDGFSFNASSPLTQALLSELRSLHGTSGDIRKGPSRLLVAFLNIWARPLSSLETIELVQNGRNSWLGDNGMFV